MAKLKMPKSGLFTSKKGRRKKVADRAKVVVTTAVPDDPEFVECFVKSSPTLAAVLKDDGTEVEEADLAKEARVLHDALGSSKEALHYSKPEGKYKELFSFAQELHPPKDPMISADRSLVCDPFATTEGPIPTFFQFQRQDLPKVLKYYARHATLIHGPDHICRSLILAMAMAKCYVRNGQKRYVAGKDVALGDVPAPNPTEVDFATIFFGVAFHDSGRDRDGPDYWEHESGRNAFYYMREIGYSCEYAANVAKIIVKNEETNSGRAPVLMVSRTSTDSGKGKGKAEARNVLRMDKAPPPEARPFSINDMIVHDADTLEIQRLLLVSQKAFLPDRFQFLNNMAFDSGIGEFNRNMVRNDLIEDARNLAQLTVIVAANTPRDNERTEVETRFLPYTNSAGKQHGGFEPMLKEYERFIIDAIFANPKAFPFLYTFYFDQCFDTGCPELNRMSSEQRLALIRTRLHSFERAGRDQEWAAKSVQDYNSAKNGTYAADALMKHVIDSRLTMNVAYPTWDKIIVAIGDDVNPTYKQYWEIFWKNGIPRQGGAGDDPNARDAAEIWKLNYHTHHTDPAFRDICHERPNYAGVNGALNPTGAVTKYGKTAIYLHRHVVPRLTYTFRDTFGAEVVPDSVCTPDYPLALLRNIKGISGFEPDVLACIGQRKGWETGAGAVLKGNLDLYDFMYVEAQVHGPILWKQDVDAIVIEVTTTNGALDQKISDFAKKFGIRLGFSKKGGDQVFATRVGATNGAGLTVDVFTAPAPTKKPQKPPRPKKTHPKKLQESKKGKEPAPVAKDEGQRQCPHFKPNRWKPNLCTVCQSTPNSLACKEHQA